MQKDVIEMFEQSAETAMEAARKVGDLNMRAFDKLFQQQADLAAFYMDATTRSMELVTKAKGYQDLMAGQMALVRECGERCISTVRQTVAFASETATEYTTLAQDGIKVAQDQMTQAAGMAMKAAA
ncbi:MAG: phasin family protein [Betaproteobacteria bacterium]|nr:phasin family protein [Betaproteobacteria bacterium]